ncbi:hypothetical protein Tco_0580620 [Tanacetum coccineum]
MQWKNPSRVDTKRTNISSRSRGDALHLCFLISHHLRMSSYSVLALVLEFLVCTSMKTSIDSRLTKRNDSSLLWKSSEDIFIFSQVRVENFMHPGELLCSLFNQSLSMIKLEVLTSAVPPKIARKFKKASPSKKDSIPVQADEELVQKGKRVKRPAKKSSTTPAAGIVFRETPVKTKSTGKEKVDVSRRKVINQEEEEVDQGNESEDDEIESDEDKGMDDTTYQFDDDVDARLKEPTQTDKEVVQGEGADAEMIDAQQGNENLETTQEQVVEDAHVTISTVTKKTEVPATSSSRSSDLASKFLIFLDIPHTDAEIVSLLDVHVHHEVPRTQAPTLLTIPISIITESSPVLINIPQSSQTFTPPPILTTPTPPLTIETTNPISTLPDFASVFRFNDKIQTWKKSYSRKVCLSHHILLMRLLLQILNFVFKDNFLLDKMEKKVSHILMAPITSLLRWFEKILCYRQIFLSSYDVYLDCVGRKDKDKDEDLPLDQNDGFRKESENQLFEVADSYIHLDQEGIWVIMKDEPRNETASRVTGIKKPTPPQEPTDPDCGDYPFDLSKPLPLIKHGKRQRVPFEFFINNDLKYLQGGILTMTYTTSTTKTKAAKYDLPGIEDMVPNIWSPVKVAYDRYALWVTYVKVMRKHGYGYLEEIVVRRADNALYRFKEGDDVADFAIALRMFTRSLVIQKRVEDLQLGVESYQKKINVTSLILYRLYLRRGTSSLSFAQRYNKVIVMGNAKEKMEQFGKEGAHFIASRTSQSLLKERVKNEKNVRIKGWKRKKEELHTLSRNGVYIILSENTKVLSDIEGQSWN